ncbi:Hsp70 family protein [Dactylosporangium sucinum]|uniref:Uncharacterized protein n=1 Tax=Dactylosporangium sucinum TaxID=1424081 RepID=A0A917X4J8_9ACTN|nr:Hsp70 family protein [Dactylosporangium sucinum]GGM65727.1 hypothetical protein GCM10007977_079140 [Dactylosporangium sucinum]
MGDATALVVDFGTSASSAALVAGGQVRLLKEPSSGLYSWPSAVSLEGDRLLVGTAAERRKRAEPGAYRGEFKRDLGQALPVPLGERTYAPEELVAAVLNVFRDRAAELHGEPVHRLLLTVPASYGEGDPRRALMVAAGEAAGFPEVQLVAEPVAAAFAPVAGAGFAAGQVVLVYDFGGGTFDAAVVRCGDDGVHEIIGHAALDDCGGRDIDALLASHVRASGGPALAETLTADGLGGLRMRLQLADFVRGVKHQLTDAQTVEDFVTPLAPPYRLDRPQLDTLVAPLLERTVDCCRELLRECRVDPRGLTAVLLVGGTSRMPAVREAVAEALRVPARWAEDPELAVVQGAAALAGRAGARRLAPSPPVPDLVPLRWDLPGEMATVLRWLAEPGTEYEPGADLAVVRTRDGMLWTLTAPDEPGTLAAIHAPAGTSAVAGDWLATVAPTREPAPVAPDLPELIEEPRRALSIEVRFGDHAAFSSDGRWFAVEDVYDGCVWDATSGTLRTRVKPKGGIDALAFSPDGERLVTAGNDDGRIIIWELAAGERLLRFDTGTRVKDLALSPDGRWIVTACDPVHTGLWPSPGPDRHGKLTIWDAGTGARHRDLPLDGVVKCLAISPDGTRLATGGDRFGTLWDLDTGKRLFGVQHKSQLTAVAFSSDGTRLATASWDSTAALWDTATGQRLVQVRHGKGVSSMALSPSGRWLATANDKQVRLWDALTGALLRTIEAANPRSIAFHPDGLRLAIAGSKTRIWQIASEPGDPPEHPA